MNADREERSSFRKSPRKSRSRRRPREGARDGNTPMTTINTKRGLHDAAATGTQDTLIAHLFERATDLAGELGKAVTEPGAVRNEKAMRLRTLLLMLASIPARSAVDVCRKQALVTAWSKLTDIEPSVTVTMVEAAIEADVAGLGSN